jgi:hypothetical protein
MSNRSAWGMPGDKKTGKGEEISQQHLFHPNI